MAYAKKFTRSAYNLYLGVRQLLVERGTPEVEIDMALRAVMGRAELKQGRKQGIIQRLSTGNPSIRMFFQFFDYVIECEVDDATKLVRIVDMHNQVDDDKE